MSDPSAENSDVRLQQLREAIDETDSALLNLLQRRKQLAAEVGVVCVH